MISQTRRAAGFWLVALTSVVFLAAASAPSPLYVVYQQEWHFSATMLTVVFAVYAAVLLLTLLIVGGLSDFIGRRPVIVTAIALEIASLVVFLLAGNVADLLLGRAVQGLATGVGLSALSAMISDLAPPERPSLAAGLNVASPTLGLALGALLSGLLVEFAPHPTSLVYVVLTILLAVLLLACAVVLPAPGERRPGALASLRPAAKVPPVARRAFRNAVPVLIATWSLGGLVLSLGGSLAVGVFDVHNHVIGGIVVTALTASGSLAAFLVRGREPRSTMLGSALVLVLGMIVILAGVEATSMPVFFAGLVIGGLGFGAGFVSALGSVVRLAQPHERAELLTAVFVPSYGAFGGAAVLAGLAVPEWGLRPTLTVFGLVVIGLALVAVAAELTARRQEARQVVPGASELVLERG